MKSISGSLFKSAAFVAVALVGSLGLFGQSAVDRDARVTALSGSASYSHAGGAFIPLTDGAKLGKGDVIKTGAGSHVDVDLGANVGVIQAAPNSTVSLDTLTVTQTAGDKLTDTQLSLNSGTLYFKVNKLAKGSRYEITTPKGIAGIRGTAGSITANGQLTLTEGQAGMAFGPNDVVIVNGGETVGPNDRPAHPASPETQREIVEALRDAAGHGNSQIQPPFVQPLEPFISPTLPGK